MRRLALTAFLIALPVAAADSARVRAVGIARHSGVTTVAVTVDLSGVVIDGKPAVLGGYIARVTFDPAAVTYLGTDGGSDPFFHAAPASTDAAKANHDGQLRVVGVQTNPDAPAGVIDVASLRFSETRAHGIDSVRIVLEQAAASPRPGQTSSARIPVEEVQQ